MKRKQHLISLLAVLIVLLSSVGAYAAESAPAVKSVDFERINSMKVGDVQEYQVFDKDGEPVVVGIECISQDGLKGSKTHKVYYTGGTINCRFYMKVTNNKVTRVYDDWILIVGGTYDNDVLTKTNKYGKLTFKVTSAGNIISGKCWLKGTVTGSGNAIKVTWQM